MRSDASRSISKLPFEDQLGSRTALQFADVLAVFRIRERIVAPHQEGTAFEVDHAFGEMRPIGSRHRLRRRTNAGSRPGGSTTGHWRNVRPARARRQCGMHSLGMGASIMGSFAERTNYRDRVVA